MGRNLFVGCVMMAVCVAIQCFVVSVLLRALFSLDRRQMIKPTIGATMGVLIVVMLVMVAGNLGQIALWSTLFLVRGEFHEFATAFYHSVVNFTTLGYGDVVMSERGRLLGALEAANGVLMFGLTTSVLFVVLSRQVHSAWDERMKGGSQSALSAGVGWRREGR